MHQGPNASGDSAGIGLEIALQLLRLGDTVVLCSRSISSLPDQSEEVQGFVDAKKAFLVSADLGTVSFPVPCHA